MPSVTLSQTLQLHQVEEAAKRYHYQERPQMQALLACYQDMKKRICRQAAYEILYQEDDRVAGWLRSITPEDKQSSQNLYMAGIVTLGESVDLLQDRYSQQGEMLMAYGVEVLGMEWLALWTEELIQKAVCVSGLHPGRIYYPGEEIPLEGIADFLKLFPDTKTECNQAFVMNPKKTVLFLAALQEEAGTCSSSACESCSRDQCEYRKQKKNNYRELNYGYQRIFGT